jgi:hypothetical protein
MLDRHRPRGHVCQRLLNIMLSGPWGLYIGFWKSHGNDGCIYIETVLHRFVYEIDMVVLDCEK